MQCRRSSAGHVILVNVRVECQDMTEYISENAADICGLYVKVDVCPTSCHHVFQSKYTQVKFARKHVIICCGNMKFAKAKQCQNIRFLTCQTTCQTTRESICEYSPNRCYNVLQLIFRISARLLSEYMPDVMSDFMSAIFLARINSKKNKCPTACENLRSNECHDKYACHQFR